MLLPKTINTFGVWTQYANYRFKEPYDILLKDGKILLSAFPNGGGWGLRGDDKKSWELFNLFRKEHDCDWIEDSDVVAVRLLTDSDIEERGLTWFTGAARMKRINEYHAEGRAHVILPKDYLVKDDQVREFVNDVRDIAVKYGATQQLRAHVGKKIKEVFKNLFVSELK